MAMYWYLQNTTTTSNSILGRARHACVSVITAPMQTGGGPGHRGSASGRRQRHLAGAGL